jgi:hypothetical protein
LEAFNFGISAVLFGRDIILLQLEKAGAIKS